MFNRLAYVLVLIAACSSSPHAAPTPDATTTPKSVAGIFRVTSSYELARVPAGASALLAELADATDSPDDPARYLVEKMIASMPDPQLRVIAHELEPLLAAAVETELDAIAPKLVPAVIAIAHGLERDARQLGTRELWRIQLGGAVDRAVIAVTFDGVDLPFLDTGLPDPTVESHVALEAGGELAIADHALPIAYGAVLRVALDRVLIPSAVPGARDLRQALFAVVDCNRLGERFSASLGVGTPSLYATACHIALTQLADRWYAHLAAIDVNPTMLHATGTARGFDHDGDGAMDEIAGGTWSGTVDGAPLGAATFSGAK
jgi:hypothetical protein